jgi:hypothetical protein
MKYVMFERKLGKDVQRLPVLFPTQIVHSMLAESLIDGPLKGWTPVSAGETYVSCGPTHGKSTTLGLQSVAEDRVVINSIDYFHGLGGPQAEPALKWTL